MSMPYIDSSFEYESQLANVMPEANKLKHDLVCPIHKRRVRLSFDYNDDGINAYVTYSCCQAHAQTMLNALEELEVFDHIEIK